MAWRNLRNVEVCKKHLPEIQDDLFGGSSKLFTINHALLYRRKRNLANIYVARCGDNWVTEDVEIVSFRLKKQADTKPRI